MNINIVLVKMKGILNKYNGLSPSAEEDSNKYAHFRFAYINYYKPFQLYVLKDLRTVLTENNETLEQYREYVLDLFFDLIKEDIYTTKQKDSEFIEKLSESMYVEFNKILSDYKNLNSDSKKSCMNHFIVNKKKALLMILEKNPYLFLKTVANIKSPLMQFFILNKIPEVIEFLPQWFNSFSEIKFYIVLIEYFFYPLNIEPKAYYNSWQGEPLIHVKFANSILTGRYDDSKIFLKMKYKFEIDYLTD